MLVFVVVGEKETNSKKGWRAALELHHVHKTRSTTALTHTHPINFNSGKSTSSLDSVVRLSPKENAIGFRATLLQDPVVRSSFAFTSIYTCSQKTRSSCTSKAFFWMGRKNLD